MRDHDTRLTVLNVAYPFAPVGADAVGGSEQILSLLDRALAKAGHTSLVAAREGSDVAGRLFPVSPLECVTFNEPERRWYTQQLKAEIDRALLLHCVDIVHMHGLDFYDYDFPPGIPVLVTLHMPIAWYGTERLKQIAQRVQLCCVSHSQLRSFPAQLGNLPVVENGVELPPWPSREPKRDFAVVLGRICPEKNVHAALQAGTMADMRVLLGGRVFPFPEHQAYFNQAVEPLLGERVNGVSHEFLGQLGTPERRALLSQARCLLHPTIAPETSSLVAMEALACGTPVIAYRSGALPEIIENGVTGFLVDNLDEMAQAIRRVDSLSPQACRRAAELRFRSETMVENYFSLYRATVREHASEPAYA